tara:strand:- start:533 stop:841 length:309 start_codon:yes stop_codon:yes gene_type:complete
MRRELQYEKHEDFMKRQLDLQVQENAQSDIVKKPPYYERWNIEPITFIMKNDMPFWMGNVIKYVVRAGAKENTDEVTDLEKAKRYIDMRINQLEGREPNYAE